ncbi:hypothetical protein D3C81_1713710 [compost metagenome]
MKKISVIAPASKRLNKVGAFAAIIMLRPINSKYRKSNTQLPIRPNSSENTAKMKSVVRSGMNSRCACVPLSQPLPVMPPEPIAIVDWMIWKPLPSGSVVGSISVSTRPRW